MKLFIDFDEVLADSIKAVLQILNKKYNRNVTESEVLSWNFVNVFPETDGEEISRIFDEPEFWDYVTFKSGAKAFMEFAFQCPLISDITIVSVGRKNNLIYKEEFIKNVWGDKVKFVGVFSHECVSDKSSVDMRGGLFVDDNQNNLFSSNADIKILFQNTPNAEWNNKWQGDHVTNFTDLMFYIQLLEFVYYTRYENASATSKRD